ncbi:MAG: glycerol-3-phosphate acyltransferase [Planctomycetes bacterium]|nr:glycerol-3-phosphate acyltransferase [Planctomycetota bacterium]
MELVLASLAAYLLGGVPFAWLLVRLFRGVDVRTIGSGNVGATNAARAFGPRARGPVFVLVYLLDLGKGLLPALWGCEWLEATDPGLASTVLGAASVLGHCTSPFLGFRGGKGVATNCGVVLILDPRALFAGLGVFLVVWLVTRRVYLGSLALGMGILVATVFRDTATAFTARLPSTLYCAAMALLLFWTHRSNIQKALAARRAAGAGAP